MIRLSVFALSIVLLLTSCSESDVDSAAANPNQKATAASMETFEKFPYPKDVANPAWLSSRQQKQLAAKSGYDVFCDFHFEDLVESSGVLFKHVSVEDACKVNVAGHYDHGNGIAAADVNGDGLLDLYWTTQIGGNQLWKNLGNNQFEEITSPALKLEDRISVAASFADTDNDGDADLFVSTVRGGNVLLLNDGTGHFTDGTESSGLGYVGHSSAGEFFDYDRDGLLDLFVCNVGVYTAKDRKSQGGNYTVLNDAFAGHLKPEERNEASVLYRNLGNNRFQDVTGKAWLVDVSWTGDASPVDINRDGWIDLYVCNMQGHDEYYENVGGTVFNTRSREIFPKTPWGSMGIKFFDYNNDGAQDLYLTDMHSDMSQPIKLGEEHLKSRMLWPESFLRSGGQSIFGNAFFRRERNGFVEISQEVNAENYWPWGLSSGDLNADGFIDLFVACSMNYPFRYAENKTLLNDQGKRFLDSEFILNIEPRRGGRTAKPNFTLDPMGADKDHQLVKEEGLTEPVEVWGALGTRSSIIADIDNDGDLDIITNEFNDGPMMLVSNLSEKQPELQWLKVSLEGKQSNRDGLGATVQVAVDGSTFTQVLDGQSGYLGQSTQPLYFGLGKATQVKSIVVQWPSGRRQLLQGPIPSNQLLEISEQAG